MPEMVLLVLEDIQDFMGDGGPVLWIILGVTLLMLTLLVNRLFFLLFQLPKRARAIRDQWAARAERHSWHALQIRRALLADLQVSLTFDMPVLRGLVAICPMLGLIGTVFGMMQVFDAMAITGTGNAKALATGISHATLPTMAGMVVAITGLYFVSMLESRIRNEVRRLKDSLV